MTDEIKIMLPPYKIIYSVLIVLFLPIVRGISSTDEIGPVMDIMISALTMVMIADTYLVEKREQRWEIVSLFSIRNRKKMIYTRLIVQFIYIFLLAAAGYFMFFIWKPILQDLRCEMLTYLKYLLAVGISMVFWGVAVLVSANLTGNIWKGIGMVLVMWGVLLSTHSNRILGRFNVFAYAIADNENGITDWLPGKIIGLLIAVIIGSFILPKKLEFRRD